MLHKPTEQNQQSDTFDELLLQIIDETIKYCLGETNANIVYNYLTQNGIPKHEIPRRLEEFSTALRNLMGDGKHQILAYAPILEETILEALSIRLKLKLEKKEPTTFSNQIMMIKEGYKNEERNNLQLATQNDTPRQNSIQESVLSKERG